MRVFIGYDHRQPVSYNVLQQSIFTNSSKPVSITALKLDQLPLERQGLTPFTFSRFLVPWLCNYQGWALFLDIDILVKGDIAELFSHCNDDYAIMVSKNELRFEWASVMLFNCGHKANRVLTPKYVETADRLHQISWCKEEVIGDFPREWNHLVGYDKRRDDAKLIHYTQGVPCFPETIESEYAEDWHNEHKRVNSAYPWYELMGNSIHAGVKDGKVVPKFVAEGR
jgi:lipopolysaccharide biosynthesis glycosyltransferase